MMQKYTHTTIQQYLALLSEKSPVPGGGSASALVGATGAALLSMVARYSHGTHKPKAVNARMRRIVKTSEAIRKRLLALVDLDAQAYRGVIKARNSSAKVKKAAQRKAQQVPREVCRLCYQAVAITPALVKDGSPYLTSDVSVALELLLAAFNAARITIRANN